jgi:hypothetical protein
MGAMMMRIETMKKKGSPMKQVTMRIVCIMLFSLTLGVYAPEVQANANKTDYCFRCHSVDATTDTVPATIVTSLNGTVGTSITVAPGDSFELDYKVTNISGNTQKDAVAVGVALPHFSDPGTYTTALTTLWSIGPGTFIPSNITGWNNAWDQGTGGIGGANHYNLRGDFTGNTADANYTDAYPVLHGIDHSDGTQTSVWGVGGGTKAAVDDGVVGNGDLDGTLNTMGNDATITVPADTPVGVYTIAAYMIGHLESDGTQGFVKQEITVTVASGADVIPPNVTTTIPADTATGVAVDSQVTINWDEPIACATVNTTNITFTFGTGSLTLNSCSGSQAVFDVSGQTASAVQQVTVSTGVTDVAGNAMTSNYQFFYNTGAVADVTPPNVTTTFPTDGATAVTPDGLVTISFDENIDCATANITNITSDSPGWSLASCGGSSVSFNTLGQADGTLYNVNVTTGVTDVAGNFLSAAYPFSFTTAGVVNGLPSVPVNPAQYQSNGTTPISVSGFATSTTIIFEADLFDPDADTVKLQIDYTGDLNFDCETALVASGTANVQVSCPGLVDGNSYDWSYRAVDSVGAGSAWTAFNGATPDFSVDATAPSVSSSVPTDTATGVSINSQVTINFDEDVCATVNTTNVTSDSPTWILNNCTAGVAVFDTGGQSASTTYNVSATAAVTDPAGNALSPAPYNFSYTTGAAVNNAPTVVGSLAQYEDDGTTPIAGGGNSATNAVVIEAQINDADGDVLVLEVDIDSDGNVDCVSSAVSATGTPQSTCTALVDGAYDWQVRATDDQGASSGWSPLGGTPDFNIVAGVDIGVDTTPPTESGFALAPGDSIIDLSWNPADDGAGSGLDPVNTYKVVRSTVAAPADCTPAGIYTGNINAYSDTAVTNGTTYYYRVCAYDNLGNVSTGQTASAAPGSACTYNTPTVTILGANKDITSDGGFVDYTIQVSNTDVGACVATDFDLVLVDDNGTNFYTSTFGVDPLNVSGGGSAQTTIRVTAIAGQPNTSANNTYFYTATDGNHAQSANSNTITSTINVSGGGCVSTGSYLNGSGDQLILSR